MVLAPCWGWHVRDFGALWSQMPELMVWGLGFRVRLLAGPHAQFIKYLQRGQVLTAVDLGTSISQYGCLRTPNKIRVKKKLVSMHRTDYGLVSIVPLK